MGETLLFGSEIKAFLQHPHFRKELNTAALEEYLTFQYSAMEETFFKGVFRLQPAHYFTYKDGKLDIRRYWDVHFQPDDKPSLEDWVQEISAAFRDSIAAHKIADVEVGSFLSSGVPVMTGGIVEPGGFLYYFFKFGIDTGVFPIMIFMGVGAMTDFGPLIGSAGVSAVPMAARVSNKVALDENPTNFILMQAMGPNVSGVIGSAVVAGVLYTLCR
jgi:hypothetical protein